MANFIRVFNSDGKPTDWVDVSQASAVFIKKALVTWGNKEPYLESQVQIKVAGHNYIVHVVDNETVAQFLSEEFVAHLNGVTSSRFDTWIADFDTKEFFLILEEDKAYLAGRVIGTGLVFTREVDLESLKDESYDYLAEVRVIIADELDSHKYNNK